MTAEIYFSNNYRDLCQEQGTGAGFQFEFSCGRCYDTWRSPFEPYTGARMASWVSKGVNAAWGMLGRTGAGMSSAADGLEIDAGVTTGACDRALWQDFQRLAPFGPGNPEPLFAAADVRIERPMALRGGHVRCTLLMPNQDVLDLVLLE